MAHIWLQEENDGGWGRRELAGEYFGLRPGLDSPLVALAGPASAAFAAVIACYVEATRRSRWVLFGCNSAGGVLVNGVPLLAGLAVLKDRDEILLPGRTRLYFSTEELPAVVPYPGGANPEFCARCHRPLAAGAPVVRCPSCGRWCDQTEERPCWTYGPTCPLCGHPTAFDTDLRWTPEQI